MENLKVAIIPVTPLMQNSCVIWNENTKNAAVTDPGGDLDKINDFLIGSRSLLQEVRATKSNIGNILIILIIQLNIYIKVFLIFLLNLTG